MFTNPGEMMFTDGKMKLISGLKLSTSFGSGFYVHL